MTVWRLVTHHQDSERLLALSKSEGRIAVGWNAVGDLRDYGSEAEVREAVKATGNPNWPSSGKQLLAFRDEMQPGDLAILSAKGSRRCMMRIEGPYEYAGALDDERDYSHRRPATPTDLNADALWKLAGGIAEGQSVRWTVVRLRHEVTPTGERIAE